MTAKYQTADDGWRALMSGKHPFSTGAHTDAPEVRHRPNKHKSHDHETYARVYKKDLDQVGCLQEFGLKGDVSFWPAEKMVDIGKGKKAPRPFESKREQKEFLHRLESERGWTFQQA